MAWRVATTLRSRALYNSRMSKESETARLFRGWRIQARTIHALLVRDMMMRYGRENIGFVWAILEPMILTVGVMVIWSTLNKGKEGIRMVELVFTGYMPLTLWRHLTGYVLGIFRANWSVLFHRQVTLFDILISRQLLEIIGASTALVIVYATLTITGVVEPAQKLHLVLLGWFMMAWIGVAFGTILCCWCERHEVAERFVQPIQYLNIPISGAFFLVDWMPGWAQKIIMYHPLVHCYEVFRAGFFGETIVSHYNLPYFVVCTFIMTFLAFVMVRRIREHVRLN